MEWNPSSWGWVTEQVEIRPRYNKLSEYNLSKINITEYEEANRSKISDAEWILIKKETDLEINSKETVKYKKFIQ